jgi:DNA-binding transcriptional LysR family regulator
MDKAREMASFVAVVNAGSFVGAAEHTGLSKAAVSRHVQDLESRLGVRLLHRTTRRLSMTTEGQAFYVRSRDLLTAIDEAESELTATGTEPTGLIRVNAPLTFGVLHLAPIWGRFATLNPKVSLDVVLNDRMADLIEEGFDLAIRIASLPSSTLISRKLAGTRMILCASPQFIEKFGMPQAPSDLARLRAISYSYWSTHDEWHFTGPSGPVSVRINACFHTNNGDTCRSAALDHQGIILQPDFLIGGDLQRGTLIELLPQFHAVDLGIYAVYPSRKYLPLKLRRLIDFLADSFRKPPWAAWSTAS